MQMSLARRKTALVYAQKIPLILLQQFFSEMDIYFTFVVRNTEGYAIIEQCFSSAH